MKQSSKRLIGIHATVYLLTDIEVGRYSTWAIIPVVNLLWVVVLSLPSGVSSIAISNPRPNSRPQKSFAMSMQQSNCEKERNWFWGYEECIVDWQYGFMAFLSRIRVAYRRFFLVLIVVGFRGQKSAAPRPPRGRCGWASRP